MQVTIDIEKYKAAIEYVLEHNPIYYKEDEEEARETLDRLIKDAFEDGCIHGTGGFTVVCSDYSDDKTSAYVDILVSPSLGKDSYYIQMAI